MRSAISKRRSPRTIASVERAVLDAAHEASRAPNDLASGLMTLSAELQAFAVSHWDAILPHEDFLATRGAAAARSREEARARAARISRTPPVSEKLRLPYLAARHDELRALLQLRPLCKASSASWREGGCAALRERFDEARTAIEATLPRQIASGVRTMRERGVDTALLEAVQDKLDAGDGKGAAIAHDAAVRASEGR